MSTNTFYAVTLVGALVGALAMLAAIAWDDFVGSRR